MSPKKITKNAAPLARAFLGNTWQSEFLKNLIDYRSNKHDNRVGYDIHKGDVSVRSFTQTALQVLFADSEKVAFCWFCFDFRDWVNVTV